MSKKNIEELFDGYNGEYEKEDIDFGEPVGHEKFWEEDKLSDQEYPECVPKSAVNRGARLIIRICRVKCNRCGDMLEYRHKTKTESPHVLLTCRCKTVTIDPVPMALRILYKNAGDFTELHEYWEEPHTAAAELQDEDALIDKVAAEVLERYRSAFEELAKED